MSDAPSASAGSTHIPRLFQLRAGDQLGDLLADGVLWPDGSVTVCWRGQLTTDTEGWVNLAQAGAELEAAGTVVWLREDTYT